MLGVRPQIGRVFTQKDEVPGFINAVVLSDGFWRRQYGADPNVIGKSLRLDGDLYQIFGVMPAGFRHPRKNFQTVEDVYVAAGYNAPPFPVPPLPFRSHASRRHRASQARLSVAEAQARLETFDAGLARDYPTDYPPTVGWARASSPCSKTLPATPVPELFVLFAAVGFVLLIACVNLANLLFSPRLWSPARNCDPPGSRCWARSPIASCSRKASSSLSFPAALPCLPSCG